MNQKRFANIVLIVLVVVLIGVAGYFTLVKKLPEVVQETTMPPTIQEPSTQESTPTQPLVTQPTTSNGVGGGIPDNPEGYLDLNLAQTLPSPSVQERSGFLEISFSQTCGTYYRIYARPTISGDDRYSLVGEIITNPNKQNCTTTFRHTDSSRAPFNKTNTQQYIYTIVDDQGKNRERSGPSVAILLPAFPSVDITGFKPTPDQCSVFSIPNDVIQKRISNEKIDLYRVINSQELRIGSTNFIQPIPNIFKDNSYLLSRLREMDVSAVQKEFFSSASVKSVHNLDQNNWLNFLVFTDQQMIFYHTQPVLPNKIFIFTVDNAHQDILETAMITGLFNWGCG